MDDTDSLDETIYKATIEGTGCIADLLRAAASRRARTVRGEGDEAPTAVTEAARRVARACLAHLPQDEMGVRNALVDIVCWGLAAVASEEAMQAVFDKIAVMDLIDPPDSESDRAS